jgi:phosphatidate cytidylyltransferase
MLGQRIATAVLLIAAFLAALLLAPPNGWIAIAAAVLALGAWEWGGFARLTRGARIAYAALMTLAGLVAAVLLGLAGGRTGIAEGLVPVYACAALFWIAAVPVWLHRVPAAPPRGLVLLIGWVVLLPTFLALIHLRNIQPLTLLGFMMVVWIADIAAYFAGRRFGRRKLAPRVSPGKTWEGFFGAMAATAAYAILWIVLAPQHTPSMVRDLPAPLVGMLALVAVLAVLSVLGDLFESAMKRQAGLKDSGSILPGHGGVLDRIDALTSVLPVAALVSLL